jgi:hypothetical protein
MERKKVNEKKNEVKTSSVKKEEYPFNQDIKHDLKHFIYGMIFGALLMLIFLRMLQLS